MFPMMPRLTLAFAAAALPALCAAGCATTKRNLEQPAAQSATVKVPAKAAIVPVKRPDVDCATATDTASAAGATKPAAPVVDGCMAPTAPIEPAKPVPPVTTMPLPEGLEKPTDPKPILPPGTGLRVTDRFMLGSKPGDTRSLDTLKAMIEKTTGQNVETLRAGPAGTLILQFVATDPARTPDEQRALQQTLETKGGFRFVSLDSVMQPKSVR